MKKSFIALFLLIPIVLSSLIFVTPDKAMSENENRALKTKQTLDVSDFQNDFESYLSDQFLLRDTIVASKSKLQYAFGKRDINGAYIGKNRFLQKITESDIDEKSAINYASKINNIAKNIETYVIYVPSAGCVLKNELPSNAEMYDYDALKAKLLAELNYVTVIDLTDVDYYKTDHHWNAQGSYSAYKSWCKEHKQEPKIFNFETVSTDFKGTLYSKALMDKFDLDTIEAPVISEEIIVTADGQEIELYDSSALETKDKYNYFQGGNHGILTIENKNVHNGKRLLILKDSFANSFVPYLVGDYEKIIMLDERYTFITPSEIIESENVTELAVIKEIIS